MPTKPGFPFFNQSINIHVIVAVAAEICVTNIAIPALALAARAEPALKPNQPTQSIHAPIIANTGLCGGLNDFGKSFLGPR